MRFPLREAGDAVGDALSEAAATVLLEVPGIGADIGEEPFHPRRVAIEQLAVQVAWIPADQNIADVENNN
jgi:hypothetical protein